MSSFSLGFASSTLPCNSSMHTAIRAHSNKGANNTFLSSKGIAPSRNMVIKDKDNRNCHDICVAAIAAPPSIMDVAWESRNGIGIIDFLERRNFLITGETRFLSKVLIEKILCVAPNIGKIFLLIKAKDEQAAMDRVKDEIMVCELFKCLQQKYGEEYTDFMLSKLVLVKGDIREWDMGIGGDSFRRITQEVDVIINSAANTTLDERVLDPLILSYEIAPWYRQTSCERDHYGHGKARDHCIELYHAASFTVNPMTMGDMFNYSRDHFAASPLTDNKGGEIQITNMEYFSSIDGFSFYIQKDIAEKSGLSKEIGPDSNPKQRSRLEARCKRMAESLIHLAKLYEPYMFYHARIDSTNTIMLMEQKSAEEGNRFQVDLRSMSWDDYFANAHIPGLKRNAIKKASSS
ncbi:hypothetical protein BT93_K2097 [Corymbia citriodora subsp. variegata]|nr:hypothetical protein BT93_K2097 [Corymbia citriodora subsp. variegata]